METIEAGIRNWKEGQLYKITGFNMRGHQMTLHYYRNQLANAGIVPGTIFEFIQEISSEDLIEIKIDDGFYALPKSQIGILKVEEYEKNNN